MKFNSGKFNKIATAKNEAEERMLFSLRKHIFHERQRKKQEQEAEVEEERLREAKEMRDVMTLDKNREKLQALERSHRELQEIKQELFLKLKKLLNEDENRKKQQQKESNELAAQPRIQNVNQPWQTMPSSNPPPSSVEYSTSVHSGGPSMSGNPIYVGGSMSMNKRTRSPSPTPQHGHYYKTGGGSSGSSGGPGQPYHPPKIEEGRRVGEVSRAVLWNKPNQYATSGPGAPYYQIPNPPLDAAGRSAIIYPYSTIPSQHLRTNFVDMSQHMAGAGQKGPSQPPPQSQQQQPPAPPPGLVYDYYRNIMPMPPMGPGGVPSKDSASITRGYMKRGSND